ncbi:hypothetical protein [Blastococcus saxobsidens]|uniref:Uncharacterized protein n=1 Tax=Blastococcus saxobsidens (strain DD2) TaxID=1146883 RepID=H6RVY3_BLASD|nr:hypothetical protein [Blastococcus saxobsidens]CCG05813.1 conserved protein of unknown function [Blastococcus saxobsidens DD2]
MRFETTPRFDSDYKDLKAEHKRQFREVLPDFIRACDAYAEAYAVSRDKDAVKEKVPAYRWPAALRVSPMKSAPGIWEMTWSFASPDGRATFEFVSDDQGLILRWRRIGDHSIYKRP